MAAALILTSTETVIAHIPRFAALLIDSDEISRLVEAPERVDAAVQEGFRMTVPSPVMLRVATRPSRIGSVGINAGDRVILSNYMANRKVGDFNPEREIPKELRQLWFGAGPHFCIGMPLATRQTHAYTDMLMRVHSERRLVIRGRKTRKRTLAAGYSKLEIRCL